MADQTEQVDRAAALADELNGVLYNYPREAPVILMALCAVLGQAIGSIESKERGRALAWCIEMLNTEIEPPRAN